MASRRMFSKDVVCSDRFLDMPASAQALYFQYGLEADDDGFVSAPKKILRLTNASDDDLKILVAKGFLIPFDSGVVVIRDWKINNYLRRDRYTPTRFKEEFEQLDTIDDRYQLHVLAVGIPDDNHVVDIEKLTKEIEVAEREQDKLFATGNPFELGSKARAAKEDLEKLSQEEGKLADMHNKLQTAYDGVNDKINEYSQKADEATASTSRLSRIGGMVGKAIGSIATFGKNAAKSLTGAKKSSSGFGLSLGTLVKYGFGIRSLYVLVNKLRSALVDGFKNLSQYSGETNGSISMLWSSLERLKNSLATAFAPILTVVAPILSKFIDMLSTAASYVSMFFSFLSGKSTYTRAIAVQKNYAASLGDTASAAKDAADATEDAAKAAEDYLSPLDDLNKFTAEDTTSKASSGNSGSSGGGVDPGQMFEDVPIESNIEKIFQKIKDLIKSGDFEGLGEMMADAINRGLKKVKKAISWDNVGPTVTYFVTAFTRTFNSLVDNIDWDLLGRTIGTGINTIVNTLDLFYTGIDWKNLGSKFAEGVNGVVYEVDWAKLGQFIGHKLLALPTVIVGFIENLDWSALSKAASTLVLNFLDTLIEFNRASKQKNIVRSRPGRGKSEKNGNWKKPV